MSVAVIRIIHMPTIDTEGIIPQLLDFEATWEGRRAGKGEAIRAELGVTPARYTQLLARAAATLEGQSHDAITSHRVLRDQQRNEDRSNLRA